MVLSNLTQVYTGSALTPTATTTPAGLTIGWTNAPKTSMDTYPVTATVINSNYQGAASGSFVIGAWTTAGFYQPVDMSTTVVVWNTVKGGSTVPLKFNIFAGSAEKSSVSDIASFYQGVVLCSAGLDDGVDDALLTTGGTSLRYFRYAGFGWAVHPELADAQGARQVLQGDDDGERWLDHQRLLQNEVERLD